MLYSIHIFYRCCTGFVYIYHKAVMCEGDQALGLALNTNIVQNHFHELLKFDHPDGSK